MDDKFQAWQINPARSHICRDTDTRPTIAHGLKRMGTFVLAQFA